MRTKLLMATTTALIAFSSGAWAADCDGKLQDLSKRIASNENDYRVAVGSGMGSEIRRLHDAAGIFARNGQDDACEEVVSGINELIEERREMLNKDEMLVSQEVWGVTETARLKMAQPVSDMQKPLHGNQLIGADIRNLKNEDLGEIQDVVFDPQKKEIRYVVIAHGGFLGVGDKQIAVPWNKLKATTDDDERIYVLDVSEETLEQAPNFERSERFQIDMGDWRQENDKYFEENL